MSQMTLSVPGMSCEHCVRAISAAVSDVPGVKTVQVDLNAKLVRVGGEPAYAAVCAAIDDAGYEVQS